MSSPESRTLPLSLVIARKEFREIFRDRRTIMSVVVGPLLITPLLFALIGVMIQSKQTQTKVEKHAIGIIGSLSGSALIDALKRSPTLELRSFGSEEAAAKAIKERVISAAFQLAPDADSAFVSEKPVQAMILVDGGDEGSRITEGRIRDVFDELGKKSVGERLTKRNIDKNLIEPFQIKEKSIPGGGGVGMLFLTQMLPYMMILAAFSGAIYASFDQVAGEKERGTLETLLVSPASRRDIVLGKFGAVVAVCIISGLLSVAGLAIPFVSGIKAFEWLSKGGLTLSPVAMGVILMVMLPLSALFAGLLLTLSTFARNQKEAQTYLGSLFPLVLMPAMISMFTGVKSSIGIAVAPILNASVIIKQALNGSYDWAFIGLAFGASIFYAGIAIAIATRMFQKEGVLIKA